MFMRQGWEVSLRLFGMTGVWLADRQFHALSQSVKNFIIVELNNHDKKTMPFGVKIWHPSFHDLHFVQLQVR